MMNDISIFAQKDSKEGDSGYTFNLLQILTTYLARCIKIETVHCLIVQLKDILSSIENPDA